LSISRSRRRFSSRANTRGLTTIELLTEEDIDPFTQDLVAEYELDVFLGPEPAADHKGEDH
jgi:hypothetical protein